MNKSNKKPGFMLLEIVVSIGIIAMVLAISVPNYLDIMNRSAIKTDNISMDLITRGINKILISDLEYQKIDNSHIGLLEKLESNRELKLEYNQNGVLIYSDSKYLDPNKFSDLYNLLIDSNKPNYKGDKDKQPQGYIVNINGIHDITIEYYYKE